MSFSVLTQKHVIFAFFHLQNIVTITQLFIRQIHIKIHWLRHTFQVFKKFERLLKSPFGTSVSELAAS